MAKRQQVEVPGISQPLLRMFRRVVRGYFRRHFHGVRMAGAGARVEFAGPLVVFGNHAGWWDPMVCFLLADELFPERAHFAPMDAEALGRYAVLSKLGMFPIEMGSARGAAQFLRMGEAVAGAGGVLWVTPQGRFADPRERPLAFKPGLAALASRLGRCTLLPLAIEYTFWDERKPEALLEFGTPVVVDGETADELGGRLEAALEATMDDLKERAMRRSAAGFERVLARGKVGTGGVYAVAQRVRSFVLRRPYRAEHRATEVAEAAPGSVGESRG